MVDACSGKAAGDACSYSDGDADDPDTGTCALSGATLVCRHTHPPPQEAVDACSGLTAGAACTLPGRRADAGGIAGACASVSGTLACEPARPDPVAACADLTTGATCTLSSSCGNISGCCGNISGTCVAPSDGSADVCTAACGAFGRGFGPGWGPGPHHGH